jgi:hypothetical protein
MTVSTAKEGVVGNTTINDMTLYPGNNTLPMTGILDQILIAESLNASGWVTLAIQGQSAIYNGEHLTYYVRLLSPISPAIFKANFQNRKYRSRTTSSRWT